MRHVPIAEFQDRTSEIVAAIVSGEEVIFTDQGRNVAKLVAIDDDREAKQREAIEGMIAFREELRAKGVRISQAEMREWIDEGRR